MCHIAFLTTALLLLMSMSVRADDFSSGQLLDIINDLETLGLNYWTNPDGTVPQFYIFNDNLKRYFQLATGTVGNHVTVVGSTRPKAAGFLFEVRRMDEGYVTFAVDNDTGVGNGAAAEGEIQTGQWLTDATHQYALVQNNAALQLQNRGNQLCISSEGKNDNPLTTVTCDPSDLKQQWQLCQVQTDAKTKNLKADKLCWPRDDASGVQKNHGGPSLAAMLSPPLAAILSKTTSK